MPAHLASRRAGWHMPVMDQNENAMRVRVVEWTRCRPIDPEHEIVLSIDGGPERLAMIDKESLRVLGVLCHVAHDTPDWAYLPSILRDMKGFASWEDYLADRLPKVDAACKVGIEREEARIANRLGKVVPALDIARDA